MEKVINNTPFNTNDMIAISAWQSDKSSETLYFSDSGQYLLHCIGENARMTNKYGTEAHSKEDLFVLCEEDVLGWMEVHAPNAYKELFEGGSLQDII